MEYSGAFAQAAEAKRATRKRVRRLRESFLFIRIYNAGSIFKVCRKTKKEGLKTGKR
jgi:hypothetical protein